MAGFKQFTPFQGSETEKISDTPFDLAASEANPSAIKKSDAIAGPSQPKPSVRAFNSEVEKQKPFRETTSNPQKLLIQDLHVGKPKQRETDKCKKCTRPTFMNSVCNSCDTNLQGFDAAL